MEESARGGGMKRNTNDNKNNSNFQKKNMPIPPSGRTPSQGGPPPREDPLPELRPQMGQPCRSWWERFAHQAILAVVGPYHSGKSFLLNALVGRPNVRPPEELVVLSFDLQRNYYIKNVGASRIPRFQGSLSNSGL